MDKKVLIVAASEGFIIKGIELKLKGLGLSPAFMAQTEKSPKDICEGADLIVIHSDAQTGAASDVLSAISECCAGSEKRVAVIGSKEEYDSLKDSVPESVICGFYERPLDMPKFLTDVEKFMEEGAGFERRKSILIVDDDVSYMSMVMDWLKDDYRVSLANSGSEAINWLSKNRADLILLDYAMPEMSGPQVLEKLRADEATAGIPVMFLTGKSDEESIAKIAALKPQGHLLKTVDKKQLGEIIADFFAKQDAGN
jgi:CheY-like chemotaxis protein